MKNLQRVIALLLIGAPSFAQDLPGYRAGNYTGVNGVFFNPAAIADNRYRWDLQLFSVGTIATNNNASINFKELRYFEDDKIKTQLFGDQAGPASGMVSAQFIGPSLMFAAGKKMSFALTTRSRLMINGSELDGKLASKIIDQVSLNKELPISIVSPNQMTASANGWTEFGVSAARVFYDKGKHFFKGGLSLKYLAGSVNSYMYVNALRATLDADPVTENYVISDASGVVGIGMSGPDLSKDFDAKDLLDYNSSGLGADIGWVYEYRPGNNAAAGTYKLKIGMAVLDIGSIRYKKDVQRNGAYLIDIKGAERFDLTTLDGVNLDDYNRFFAERPQYFTPLGQDGEEVRVALPSTLQLDADYHFQKGFYVNLAGQFSLTTTNNKPYNSRYYNAVTLTPRYEGRRFGVYVPFNYNKWSKLSAGLSLRMGFFFIGSGSALTALVGDSRQADFYMGVHIGSLRRKS